MKVCFPVQQDEGIESQVYGHFGSAPVFIVVDTEGKGGTLDEDSNHNPE